MSVSTPAIVASRQAETSREEWDARVELAACYRIFDMLGWTEMIFNHITLRLPGPQRYFLINPYGLWYGEVTASNLVKIDLDGNLIGPSEWPINRAGFVIHSAIHAARDDAHCIMHTHTTAGMAIACQRDGLAPDNFYSALMYGQVAYHAFEGVTVRDDEKARLVRSLGDKSYLVQLTVVASTRRRETRRTGRVPRYELPLSTHSSPSHFSEADGQQVKMAGSCAERRESHEQSGVIHH